MVLVDTIEQSFIFSLLRCDSLDSVSRENGRGNSAQLTVQCEGKKRCSAVGRGNNDSGHDKQTESKIFIVILWQMEKGSPTTVTKLQFLNLNLTVLSSLEAMHWL